MLDNILFPQSQQGPRLDDLTVQVSTYGKAIPVIYGPENRMAGNVIWKTDLVEHKHTQHEGKGGPSVNVTSYTYTSSLAVLCGEGVCSDLFGILGNGKLIFDPTADGATAPTDEMNSDGGMISRTWTIDNKSHGVMSRVTFYPGTQDQLPDPTIEAVLGVGLTPAYRGRCYVMIENLQLADFGNRVPNLEFLIAGQETADVQSIILDICTRSGVDPNTVSTSSAVGDVRGYVIANQASGVAAIQPLALAYDFDMGEHAGGLRMTSKLSGPLGVVLAKHMGGYQAGEDRPEPVRYSRQRETTLPREAAVTYSDPDRFYQPNTATAHRNGGSAENNLSTQVALVMPSDQGQKVADRTLWEAWTARQTGQTTLDDRWLGLQCGRLYIFETPAGLEPLRVTRKTRGANGVIEADLRRDQSQVFKSVNPGAVVPTPPNVLKLPGVTELILLDIPLLVDADNTTNAAGFYWGMVGSGSGWRGADFKRALSEDDEFDEVSPQGQELTVGDVVGTLPAPAHGDTSDLWWDEVSVLTVDLRRTDMVLTSATEAAVLAGVNAAYVGAANGEGGNGEILQFKNAVATMTPGRYQISGLLRGQRGTEFTVGLHAGGEMFVLLEPGPLKRSSFGLSDVGQERAYKAVSLLMAEADADAVLWTNSGVGLRPYSPEALELTGDTGGDLVLTWVRRSRIGGDVDPPPLGEDSEAYRVEVIALDGHTIVRTVDVTAPTFTYTSAMQTADFGGAVSDLHWKVAQVSAQYGPGVYADLTGPVP